MQEDSNPLSSANTSQTMYDHVYDIYEYAAETASGITNAASTQARNLYTKADELKNRYLTTDYLTTKAKQAIYAKVLPLSTPPDLDKQIKEVEGEIGFLTIFKSNRKSLLKDTLKEIEKERSKQSGNNKKLEALIQLKTDYKREIAGAKESLVKYRNLLEYLNIKKNSTIGGRFAGYAGMVANTAIPGSGTIIGTTLTAANVLLQRESVSILQDQDDVRSAEQRNVNIGTLLTVATTISSIAFTTFMMPVIKENFWRYWNATGPLG
jgi:hypothetical protein